jgi:hypothetical protein
MVSAQVRPYRRYYEINPHERSHNMRKFIIFAASIAALAIPTLAIAGGSPAHATGNVTWDYKGLVTGSVIFDANQKTGGSLDYQNSNGMWLHGVVTSYRQIDDHTAVFAGTIIDGSDDYTVNHTDGPDYFFAKVVDGTSGSPDQIAVLGNEGPTNASGDYDMSQGAGIVTAGDLVVH